MAVLHRASLAENRSNRSRTARAARTSPTGLAGEEGRTANANANAKSGTKNDDARVVGTWTRRQMPTSPSRNAREEWSDHSCDRNFIEAWGDSSPLELGREMPNECWTRNEMSLEQGAEWAANAGEANLRTVNESRIDHGTMRRDPLGTYPCTRQEDTALARRVRSNPRRASAMGSSVGVSRHSRGSDGRSVRPVEAAPSVAPFGVSAIPRLAHVNGALEASEVRTYEVQETDGVDPRALWASPATVGDGCPGVVPMNRLRASSQRGNG